VHVGAPAYSAADIDELCRTVDHIVFNTPAQWQRHRDRVRAAGREIACGMRVNPEHSEAPVPIYSPCGPFSRLGTTQAELEPAALDGLTGLHMHALCEQNADAFERTLASFEQRFGGLVPQMSWVNFGGGHHVTRDDYDIELLCRLLNDFRTRYNTDTVYLEPGEAVALNAGVLVASVLDTMRNEMDIAILDTSATAHMPDVLEMPYRPDIAGTGAAGEKAHTYRLGGMTCLAGDIIGDYSFDTRPAPGDRLVFMDMGHYTTVKTTMFNGVKHPAIAVERLDGTVDIVREFTYSDYRGRMG
jgi:carboxynorspermidine decarboxylase